MGDPGSAPPLSLEHTALALVGALTLCSGLDLPPPEAGVQVRTLGGK